MQTLRILCLALIAQLSILHLHGAEMAGSTRENVKRGVVRVFNLKLQGIKDVAEIANGTGSGFMIDDRHLVTNHHVTEGSDRLFVAQFQEKQHTVFVRIAKIVIDDPDHDLAILEINPIPNTKAFTLCTAPAQETQPVFAAGFPGMLDDRMRNVKFFFIEVMGFDSVDKAQKVIQSLESENQQQFDRSLPASANATSSLTISIFPGAVGSTKNLKFADDGAEMSVIYHDANSGPGNSGGPLVNENGDAVGVHSRGTDPRLGGGSRTGIAYSIVYVNELAQRANIRASTTSNMAYIPSKWTWALPIGIALLISAILVVLIVVVIVTQKRKGSQSLTQLIRQHGTSEVRKMLHIPAEAAPTMAARRGSPAGASPARAQQHASGSYSLAGTTADGRRVRVDFSDATIREAGGKLTIGRKAEQVHLHIDDRSLSRQHAAITQRGQSLYLEDRESANGTWVNQDKLGGEYEAIKLKPGDRVRLGSVELTFKVES